MAINLSKAAWEYLDNLGFISGAWTGKWDDLRSIEQEDFRAFINFVLEVYSKMEYEGQCDIE